MPTAPAAGNVFCADTTGTPDSTSTSVTTATTKRSITADFISALQWWVRLLPAMTYCAFYKIWQDRIGLVKVTGTSSRTHLRRCQQTVMLLPNPGATSVCTVNPVASKLLAHNRFEPAATDPAALH